PPRCSPCRGSTPSAAPSSPAPGRPPRRPPAPPPPAPPRPEAPWSSSFSLRNETSYPQNVVHRVPPRRLAGEELRRQQRPPRVAVARLALVDQLQRLAERAEDDGVLAAVVADAERVHADLLPRPLAGQPLAPVPQLPLAQRLLHDPREAQRGPRRRVLLEPVVPLDDL